MRAGHLERAMLTGFDLQGKTLGVIGSGRIGLHAIRIGRGFGMRVLTYDVRRDPFLADLLGFSYAPLETLLATWGVPASMVQFEVTESALMDDPRQAAQALRDKLDQVRHIQPFGELKA